MFGGLAALCCAAVALHATLLWVWREDPPEAGQVSAAHGAVLRRKTKPPWLMTTQISSAQAAAEEKTDVSPRADRDAEEQQQQQPDAFAVPDDDDDDTSAASLWSRHLTWSASASAGAPPGARVSLGGTCGPPSGVRDGGLERAPTNDAPYVGYEPPRQRGIKEKSRRSLRGGLSSSSSSYRGEEGRGEKHASSSSSSSFTLPAECAALRRKGGSATSCDAAACVPNLFLVGASKCGTTTLFETLVAHPRVVPMYPEPSTNGETHVFTETNFGPDYAFRALRKAKPIARDLLVAEGFSSLLKNHNATPMLSRRLLDAKNGPLYVLEYTPHYLALPEARERIARVLAPLPAVAPERREKYVAVLRDPARRAFSQWVMKTHMRVKRYNDARSFADAARDGRERTARYAKCWDDGLWDDATRAASLAASSTTSSVSPPNATIGDDAPVVTLDLLARDARLARRVVRLASGRCHPRRFEPNLFQAYVLKSAYYYQLLPWVAGIALDFADAASTTSAPFRGRMLPERDERYSSQFASRLVVLTLERFGRAEFLRVLAFLGLDRIASPRAEGYPDDATLDALLAARRNPARDGGRADLAPDVKVSLDAFFRPYNARLDALVKPLLGGPTGYDVAETKTPIAARGPTPT